MPQQDPNLLVQQPEPFLASLYDDGTVQSFIKPRQTMTVPGQLKTNYMPGPVYQNMPLYIPPPDYGIPAPVSPTPSPSPYSEQDNDPLSGLKKFQGQGYVDQYGMYEPNKPEELSKILQKDIALSQALQMDDGFNLNMAQIDDQNLSSLDYMTPTTDTAPGLYRSPSDYYTLNDVANLCGIPSDNSAMYQQQLNNNMYQNYDGYSMQYPTTNMMDMSSDKKLSPIEQAYHASWGQTVDPSLFDKISPYSLAGKEDYNLTAFSLADQQMLQDSQNTQQLQMRGGFPAMDIQPETTIPNLRGRQNSSFREWKPSNKDTGLPADMAAQIEGQFSDPNMTTQIELLNEGQIVPPSGCIMPPDQMVPEYHNLTPLTAGPGLTPTLHQPGPPDPEALDKVRTVFMSFVDQSDENINNMDDATKHQMFVDVCNMYKSLSVINIAENLYQGKKDEEGQCAGEVGPVEEAQPEETRSVNKRYKFRLVKKQKLYPFAFVY